MDEVSKIGKISKQWTGLLREAFTDSDNFGIQFPMDLDVRMKAVMIGACFLIVSSPFVSYCKPSETLLTCIVLTLQCGRSCGHNVAASDAVASYDSAFLGNMFVATGS